MSRVSSAAAVCFEGKGKTKIQRLFPSVHQQECALCCSSPLQRHGIANIWPPRSRDLPILEKISRTASAFPQLECKQTLVSCVGEVLHSPTMKKKRMPSTLAEKKKVHFHTKQGKSGGRLRPCGCFSTQCFQSLLIQSTCSK